MWTLAIVWLISAAIFLELADRAPTLDEMGPAKRRADPPELAIGVDARIVEFPATLTILGKAR